MIELLGKSLEELQSIFKTHNIQKFRAKQLIEYIYHRYIFDFEDTISERLASMAR